jgi:hypothetical protein
MKGSGCVLIGADWSRQLFDLDQIAPSSAAAPAAGSTTSWTW